MKKIIVRLKGGLGNQLFQYSTALRIALVNDAELIIDNITGFKYDSLYNRKYALKYFKINKKFATNSDLLEPFGKIRRFLDKCYSENKDPIYNKYIIQKDTVFDPGLLEFKLNNQTTYFDGFGQSEYYFKDIFYHLKSDLTLIRNYEVKNINKLMKLFELDTIAIHVRWYSTSLANQNNISIDYYSRAVNKIFSESNSDNKIFLIFSDNKELTSIHFKKLLKDINHIIINYKNYNYNYEEYIFDFQIMKMCKHFIIGNSTFAWWAAWLREQDDASTKIIASSKIIEPKNNITAWGFPFQIPNRWTLL